MLPGCTPWPAEEARRYFQLGYWEGLTNGDLLDRAALQYPEREALVGRSPALGEVRDTYGELRRKVNRLALHLLRLGMHPGERVVLQLPNVPEFVYLYLALHRIGVIPVMCLPPHRETEIGYISQFTGAVGYAVPSRFRDYDYLPLARHIQRQVPTLRTVLVAGEQVGEGMVAMAELLQDREEERWPEGILSRLRPHPMEVATFQLSGGTTGLPKVIPRTHNDYLYNSREAGRAGGFSADTVFLATTPLAHNFTITSPGLQAALYYGAKVVLSESADAARAFALVEQEKVTYMPGVPAMIINWLDFASRSHYDFSSLRVVISGGAKLNPEVALRVPQVLGCMLQQTLGMAEGLNVFTRLTDPLEVAATTVGTPLSPHDELRVVDEEGKEVPRGEMGELWVRGPYTLRGYYNAPEHNRVCFTMDGFYKTGDMVRMDEAGRLVVEGRKKDLINRGGEKISAEEIENFILAHPKVLHTAVVAMPDPLLGERVCACVVLRPGQRMDLQELVAFLSAKRIARFKLPERLEVMEALPLTSVGKVSKKDLREYVKAKLQAEGLPVPS